MLVDIRNGLLMALNCLSGTFYNKTTNSPTYTRHYLSIIFLYVSLPITPIPYVLDLLYVL